MLGISTSTLRTWERRYGFPRPVRSPGGHRHYALAEIEALRMTLAETHNVSSAVALADVYSTTAQSVSAPCLQSSSQPVGTAARRSLR